jgi:hypothetical protein
MERPVQRRMRAKGTMIEDLVDATALPVGSVYDLVFSPYTVRVAILSTSELRFEIIEGFDIGRSEAVQYQAICVRPDVFIVSFQEANRETVVDVQDFSQRVVHTHMTLEDDRFIRMTGTVRGPTGPAD